MNPLTFVILSNGLDTLKELRGALAASENTRLLVAGDDQEQLHPEIVRLKPNAAIITLGAHPDNDLRFVEQLAAECPQTAIICASPNASPDMILRSLRAGAKDFLRLPIIAEEFRTVLERTAEFCAGQVAAPKKRGRVVAVFSSKGGCGTSFIATNIAASLQSPTVLLDLNLQAGDLSLFLGVEPKFSVADLVENRARADDSLLKSYLAPHSSTLSLMAAPREADLADDIEPEHIFEVLELLRERFDYVVVDPQHTFDSITLAALDQADEIVLVLTLDIPAIRSTQRALAIFDRLGYPRHKIRIVVNRWSKQIDLDLRQVERFLGEPVMTFIQSDYLTAVNSINLGQPLVESDPSSRIATEIRRLAATITGQTLATEASEPRKGLLHSFFRRQAAPGEADYDLRARLGKAKAPAAI
ncbi:MAG: AAA family ATPase [Pyrinomonadaceae bacterium]|nr:AAA family ATPase [Pyrinomonadaceae bacterium]